MNCFSISRGGWLSLAHACRVLADTLLFMARLQCPNKWIVGFGMDTVQIYRGLPYIGVLKPEVQDKFKAGLKP
jgi:hypothetical protein